MLILSKKKVIVTLVQFFGTWKNIAEHMTKTSIKAPINSPEVKL